METGYEDGQKGVRICKSDIATRAVDYSIEDRKGCRIHLDKHAIGASRATRATLLATPLPPWRAGSRGGEHFLCNVYYRDPYTTHC